MHADERTLMQNGQRRRWPVPLLALAVVATACGSDSTSPGGDGGGANPSVQPRAVVFVSDRDGDFDLFAMNPDGTDIVQLTDAPGDDLTPRWSPDGSRVAFSSDRDGQSAIYVMNPDGTGVTRLQPGHLPAWSPDGRSLAFRSAGGISVMSVEGTGVRSVAAQGNVDGIDWEPNGNRIAFGYPDPVFSGFEVKTETVDADGTNRQAFLAFSSHPSWSPDGSRLVVRRSSNQFSLDDIAVVTLGGGTVPIDGSPVSRSPRWSPDGAQVLYTKLAITEGVANEEIFIAAASGAGAPTQLTSNTANDRDPDWRR